MVKRSLAVVCLDRPEQNLSQDEVTQNQMFRQMITGNSVYRNGANRWFDKTIQARTLAWLVISLPG